MSSSPSPSPPPLPPSWPSFIDDVRALVNVIDAFDRANKLFQGQFWKVQYVERHCEGGVGENPSRCPSRSDVESESREMFRLADIADALMTERKKIVARVIAHLNAMP